MTELHKNTKVGVLRLILSVPSINIWINSDDIYIPEALFANSAIRFGVLQICFSIFFFLNIFLVFALTLRTISNLASIKTYIPSTIFASIFSHLSSTSTMLSVVTASRPTIF